MANGFIRRLLFGLMVLFAALPAAAQDKPIKIAIIDIDAIRLHAAVVKDIRSQIVKFRKLYQATIQKEEEELRNANQELARKRSILSPEAFAEERRKFEQHLTGVQRMVQTRKQDLDKAQGDAMSKVEGILNGIVLEMAKEKGFDLILRKNQTVLGAKSLHITKEVLELLDKKLPSLELVGLGG
jgi:outer membrane protein